jgi:hypothetical protein
MLRLVALVVVVTWAAEGIAQFPNVTISADFNPQLRFIDGGTVQFRLYDDEAHFSRLRLGVTLPNGWTAKLFQKIGRIDNDPDGSGTEEAYLERAGDWRLGKFYVPFGSQRILRETGIGARVDTILSFADLPIAFAYVENGHGKQRGFVARIGDNLGVSIAVGDHFGINGTDLTQIHPPEESFGKGRGYRLAFGADVSKQFGGLFARAEYVQLRRGNTILDSDISIADLYLGYQFPYGPLVESETAFQFGESKLNFRVGAQISAIPKVFFVPSVRYYQDFGWSYGVSVRIRL